jgi:hypothetical protein
MPTNHALESLRKHRLSTAITGLTDARGEYRFRGFHGRYEATVAISAGRTATATFDVAAKKPQCDLVVDDFDGPAMRVRAR